MDDLFDILIKSGGETHMTLFEGLVFECLSSRLEDHVVSVLRNKI